MILSMEGFTVRPAGTYRDARTLLKGLRDVVKATVVYELMQRAIVCWRRHQQEREICSAGASAWAGRGGRTCPQSPRDARARGGDGGVAGSIFG